MENIVKISAIAISAVICATVIKKQAPEIALTLSIFCGAVILFFALPVLKNIKQIVEVLTEISGISSEILKPVIKTMGIAVITKVTAEICRDAKEGGLASVVEVTGAGGALLVVLPLIKNVFDIIAQLL